MFIVNSYVLNQSGQHFPIFDIGFCLLYAAAGSHVDLSTVSNDKVDLQLTWLDLLSKIWLSVLSQPLRAYTFIYGIILYLQY
jgi:hypothetical protein